MSNIYPVAIAPSNFSRKERSHLTHLPSFSKADSQPRLTPILKGDRNIVTPGSAIAPYLLSDARESSKDMNDLWLGCDGLEQTFAPNKSDDLQSVFECHHSDANHKKVVF